MISQAEGCTAGGDTGCLMFVVERRGKRLQSQQVRQSGEYQKPKRTILAMPQLPGEDFRLFFERVRTRCKKHKLFNVHGLDLP